MIINPDRKHSLIAFLYPLFCGSYRENHNEGMGQTLLHHVVSNRLVERFQLDYVMNLQANLSLDLRQFFKVADVQLMTPLGQSSQNIVLGDVRDKYQTPRSARLKVEEPREFGDRPRRYREFFKMHAFVHLYLANECYLISTNLISGILEQNKNMNTTFQKEAFENHQGHDISFLASSIPKINLHWIPITKSQRFWSAQ
jgi:hypothetical protein